MRALLMRGMVLFLIAAVWLFLAPHIPRPGIDIGRFSGAHYPIAFAVAAAEILLGICAASVIRRAGRVPRERGDVGVPSNSGPDVR